MKVFYYLLASLIFIQSCKKADPVIPVQQELITTIIFELIPQNGGPSVTMSFQDLDGDGGLQPTITGGVLAANTAYFGKLTLLNESALPVDSTNKDILEENLAHQFFFKASNGLDLSVIYDDFDDNNQPIGLSNTVETGVPSSGKLTVTLRHEPNKSGTGVSTGDITNAGGETDIEVDFDVQIK